MVATPVPEEMLVWWWGALAAGLIVAIVVVVLLHSLYRVVRDVELGLSMIWSTGKDVARNTATTWMLDRTAQMLEEIRQEALKHDELLSRKG